MILNRNKKELDDRLIRISKILTDIYRNKSSEEYKMRGDITKSSSYANIEKMVAELSTLKGYSKSDASDLNQLFNTLHRPIFKNMVREYMTEPNERNTVFCALFTLGYRLLVGELARIFTSTEATPKGIEYKPDKVSRRNDISKIISIYKGDLEAKINAEIRTTSKASTKIEESYLEDVIAQMYIEEFLDDEFGETIYDESAKAAKEDMRNLLDSLVKPIQEAHFGRFREIRGDSPDMELPRLKNGASSGGPYPDSQRPRVVDGVEEPMLKSSTTMRNRPNFDDDDSPLAIRAAQTRANRSPYPDSQRPREVGGLEEPRLKRFGEEGEISTAVDPSYGTTTDTDVSDTTADESSVDTTTECGASCCTPTKSVQEAFGAVAAASVAGKASALMSAVSGVSKWVAPVISGLGILASVLSKVAGFLSNHNPIAEISHYFTRKYDSVVNDLDSATALYTATKTAYDEYMKIPEAQRKKKVESRYIKNMEKYNIQMKNLEAKVEDFNTRAKDDSSKPVPAPSKPTSTSKTPDKTDGGNSDKPKNDDDFDF